MRRYQKPPPASAGRNHHSGRGPAPARRREDEDGDAQRPAIASTVNFVPAARPTASPAAASGQPGGSEPPLAVLALLPRAPPRR